jgi:rRNA-processing protein EBP2
MPVFRAAVKAAKREARIAKIDDEEATGESVDEFLKQNQSESDADDASTAGAATTEGSDDAAQAAAGPSVTFVEPAAWVERMTLSALKPLPADLNPEDDPKREEAFMQHALLSVRRGIEMLERADVPWRRPTDFYAEMFKSDVHMSKIKESITRAKQALQERTQRRVMKEQKKFGKEVQAEVQRQRAQEKREMLAKVSEWRKTKGSASKALDDEDEEPRAKRGRGNAGGKAGGKAGAKRSQARAAPKPKNLRPGGKKKR